MPDNQVENNQDSTQNENQPSPAVNDVSSVPQQIVQAPPAPEPASQAVEAAQPAPAPAPAQKSGRLPKVLIVFAIVAIVAALGYFVYDRNNLQKQVKSLSSSEVSVDEEAEHLKQVLGQFIELPADETPTVATVVDAEKVRDQAFFANAQNNDKVLIFAKSGKAILYRPSTNKIIEVAPLNLDEQNPGEGAQTGQ